MHERVFGWLDDCQLDHQRPLAVAVSGGGDSMALLCLLSDWVGSDSHRLVVLSVDHGLRAEARHECARVAELSARLGHRHHLLHVDPHRMTGNLMAAARRERYRLIAEWAARNHLSTVALGHTLDDQAETFMLNLARGSGLDGLAAMRSRFRRHAVLWLRPLLDVSRHELRAMLRRREESWCEDPSNDDLRFKRARARKMLGELSAIGLSREMIAATADRLRSARGALVHVTASAARACAHVTDLCEIVFSADCWMLEEEIRRRLVVQAIRHVAGREHAPRQASLHRVLMEVRAGHGATLCGCQLTPTAESGFRVGRELAACAGRTSDDHWDGRWHLSGAPMPAKSQIGAIGHEGVCQLDARREIDAPRPSLLAAPGLWRDGALLAGPLATSSHGWRFVPTRPAARFFDMD